MKQCTAKESNKIVEDRALKNPTFTMECLDDRDFTISESSIFETLFLNSAFEN